MHEFSFTGGLNRIKIVVNFLNSFLAESNFVYGLMNVHSIGREVGFNLLSQYNPAEFVHFCDILFLSALSTQIRLLCVKL